MCSIAKDESLPSGIDRDESARPALWCVYSLFRNSCAFTEYWNTGILEYLTVQHGILPLAPCTWLQLQSFFLCFFLAVGFEGIFSPSVQNPSPPSSCISSQASTAASHRPSASLWLIFAQPCERTLKVTRPVVAQFDRSTQSTPHARPVKYPSHPPPTLTHP